MDNFSFSIKYEQSKAPLKILPLNAWVKFAGFKKPSRILEISMQNIVLDISSNPESTHLKIGKNVSLEFLSSSDEESLKITVTIFQLNESTCVCQIPLYITNEQILVDKIILEIQKNDINKIKEKNTAITANNDNTTTSNNFTIKSDNDMASILENLVAMLPEETKNNKDEKVTAQTLTEIPKSSHVYKAAFDPLKAFSQNINAELANEIDDTDWDDDDENCGCEDDDFEERQKEKKQKYTQSINPLTLLRHSIVNKFLLDNLPDQFPEESKKLEQSEITPEDINEIKNFSDSKNKDSSQRGYNIVEFLPENLLETINNPHFLEEEQEREKLTAIKDAAFNKSFDFSSQIPSELLFELAKNKNFIDKDAVFDENFDYAAALPQELIFEITEHSTKNNTEYQALKHKYHTDEFGFTIRDDDEDSECFDGDENCIQENLKKRLENKRTIEINVNNDPNFIPQTKEEADQAFLKRLNEQNAEEENKKKIKNFNFNLDI